ncbi:hypothetical protein GCM10027190_55280 [Spirosoma areae]
MSAVTMKTPEPIMEPETIRVESRRLSDRLNSVGSAVASADETDLGRFSAMKKKIYPQEAANRAKKQTITGKTVPNPVSQPLNDVFTQ